MAYKKLARLTADSEYPAGTWLYQADAETDLADVPEDGQFCIVLGHDEGTALVRSRDSAGEWQEVK